MLNYLWCFGTLVNPVIQELHECQILAHKSSLLSFYCQSDVPRKFVVIVVVYNVFFSLNTITNVIIL